MDQRTRELIIMQKNLHPGDDRQTMCQKKKKETRKLDNIEICVDVSIQAFEKYSKKSKERLITSTMISNTNVRENRETTKTRKTREEKQLYGYFKLQTGDIAHEKT